MLPGFAPRLRGPLTSWSTVVKLGALRHKAALAAEAAVVDSGRGLELSWKDGTASRLYPLWLRERCQSSYTVDTETLQPKKNPHEIPEGLLLADVRFAKPGQDDMDVAFSDGHVSRYSLSQIRAELVNFNESPLQVAQYKKLQPRYWSGSTHKLAVFEKADVDTDGRSRLELIEELLTTGMALVKNVPPEDGAVIRFGQTLSTLRGTDWGPLFNVRTKPDDMALGVGKAGGPKKDLAYTPQGVGFHTDQPYCWPTPDIQLLHAVEHCSCPGGHAPCEECQVMNYMVDGIYIAEKLRQEDPEGYKLMCNVPVRFENNGGDNGSALVHIAPHFELEDAPPGTERKIRALRFAAKSGQYAPPLGPDVLNKFYDARRRFSELAHAETDVLSLQLNPGDCLVFDNQRVLHARSEIAPTDGERWLQGAYLNRDGLWLNYERLRRQVEMGERH